MGMHVRVKYYVAVLLEVSVEWRWRGGGSQGIVIIFSISGDIKSMCKS